MPDSSNNIPLDNGSYEDASTADHINHLNPAPAQDTMRVETNHVQPKTAVNTEDNLCDGNTQYISCGGPEAESPSGSYTEGVGVTSPAGDFVGKLVSTVLNCHPGKALHF